MDSNDYFADVLDQLQLAFSACRQSMSLSSLHASIEAINQFRTTICEEVNDRAPPNMLPDELLLEVFKHSLLPWPPTVLELPSSRSGVNTRPLLWLTHVCRRWRSTALACTILWQRIDCRNIDQLQEFARRSDPSPLSLFCNFQTSSTRRLFSTAPYAHRLRRLDIVYPNDTLYDRVNQRLLTLHYPNLECLTLTHSPDPTSGAHDDPVAVVRTPISQAELPSLRALAIAPVATWLPADSLPFLTHLSLTFRWKYDIRWPTILSFLANTPALQVLHLSHWHNKDPVGNGDRHEGAPVSLPRLKIMALVAMPSLSRSLVLLCQLVVPPSCRIYLACHSSSPSLVADSVLPRLRATENSNRLTLVTAGSEMEFVAEGPSSGLWLRAFMTSRRNVPGDHFTPWLAQLPTMLPLSQISSLHLRPDLPGSTLAQIIRETVCLTTLEFMIFIDSRAHQPGSSADSLIYVCDALSQGDGTVPVSQSILCPALHSLTIAMPCGGGSRPNIIDSHPFWLSAIRSLIRARTRMCRPIRRLAVQPMHGTCGTLGKFRAPPSVVDAVYAQYAKLGEEDVEEFVLHRLDEEAIAFARWEWGEIERYWAPRNDHRPSEIYFCPRRQKWTGPGLV
ncbi:hypothetical protein C8T65DRAFT_834091 [Cerioporus squamosus]|nr:hypothetical protein C8T65DRAFT_834091 [Cerioporus squamosus]